MVRKSLEAFLAGKNLNSEQQILAELCLALATDFDDKNNTSTAAELRKTFGELRALLLAEVVEVDPIDDLLKRA